MKWTKARQLQICSSCSTEIEPGIVYLASQYSALCKECGKKHNSGELIYNRKDKGYEDIKVARGKCAFCPEEATDISLITGKRYCPIHQGDASGDTG